MKIEFWVVKENLLLGTDKLEEFLGAFQIYQDAIYFLEKYFQQPENKDHAVRIKQVYKYDDLTTKV